MRIIQLVTTGIIIVAVAIGFVIGQFVTSHDNIQRHHIIKESKEIQYIRDNESPRDTSIGKEVFTSIIYVDGKDTLALDYLTPNEYELAKAILK